MKHQFKFKVGDIVLVDEVACEVRECVIYDDEPDYLCFPLGSFEGFTSKRNELPGWTRDTEIRKVS